MVMVTLLILLSGASASVTPYYATLSQNAKHSFAGTSNLTISWAYIGDSTPKQYTDAIKLKYMGNVPNDPALIASATAILSTPGECVASVRIDSGTRDLLISFDCSGQSFPTGGNSLTISFTSADETSFPCDLSARYVLTYGVMYGPPPQYAMPSSLSIMYYGKFCPTRLVGVVASTVLSNAIPIQVKVEWQSVTKSQHQSFAPSLLLQHESGNNMFVDVQTSPVTVFGSEEGGITLTPAMSGSNSISLTFNYPSGGLLSSGAGYFVFSVTTITGPSCSTPVSGNYILKSNSEFASIAGAPVSFSASSPRCVTAFSGVRLTAPYDDDAGNVLAVINGSVGFRFSWTGLQSDSTTYDNVVKIAYGGNNNLLDSSVALSAAIRDSNTGLAIEHWQVNAVFDSFDIVLSFVYSGTGTASASLPAPAYVDITPARLSTSSSCGTSATYSLASPGDVATLAALDDNNAFLSAPYVWRNCPVDFNSMKLNAEVRNGVVNLDVSWSNIVVDSFNSVAPLLEIRHESGTEVYEQNWGPTTVFANGEVSVTAKSVDGLISLVFTISAGAKVPATGSFSLAPPVNASAHSCTADLTGVYTIYSSNVALAKVSNTVSSSLLTTTARAAKCPKFMDMSLAIADDVFTVSWSGVINADNVAITDFSDFMIKLDANAAAVFTGVHADSLVVDLGLNTKVNMQFENNNFRLSFSNDIDMSMYTLPVLQFTFKAVKSSSCGLTGSYTITIDDGTSSFSSNQLTASAASQRCPEFGQFSVDWVDQSGVTGLNVSWGAYSNPDSVVLGKITLSFDSGVADAIDSLVGAGYVQIAANVYIYAMAIITNGNIVIAFDSYQGYSVPTAGSFVIGVSRKKSVQCGQTAVYTATGTLMTLTTASGALPSVTMPTYTCPTFSGISVYTHMTVGGTFSFLISWSGLNNPGGFSLASSFRFAPSSASDVFVFSAASTVVKLRNQYDAEILGITSVAVDGGAFVVSFTPTTSTPMPTKGSILLTPQVNSSATCGTTSSFILTSGSTSTVTLQAGSTEKTYTSAPCPAVFSGVAVVSQVVAGSFGFVFSWTGFTNVNSRSLATSFRFASSSGLSDAFDTATTTVTLIDATNSAEMTGVASVIYTGGAYLVSFSSAPPTKGRLTLVPALNVNAACGTTSTFAVSSGSDAVTVTKNPSGSLSTSYSTTVCPVVFAGLKLTDDGATLASNAGLVVSWTNYINKNAVALTNILTIVHVNANSAKPFAGVPTTAQAVKDSNGSDVTGVTATLAYDSPTGTITVSFTIANNAVFPPQGSLAVLPALNAALACDNTVAFALSANADITTLTTPGVLTADFHTAVCTLVTDVKVEQTAVTESHLSLVLSYATFKQGAVEGKITLSSTGVTDLYYNNDALPITVTAQGVSAFTVVGRVSGGVATIPLSSQLPATAAKLAFKLEFATTADCDRSTTLVPATVGDISMTLASGFSSFVTPGLACTYEWRCTSDGVPGINCTATNDAEFGACSNDCGTGTHTNAPYCSRLNRGEHTAILNDNNCNIAAKPTFSKSCTDYTCSNAMWRCYASGASAISMVDCANDGGYASCAHDSGCHTNPAVQRVAVCVADSSSTADIANHCPAAVASSKPAETKACASSLDLCAAQFNSEDECSINSQIVKCGVATRAGICVNSVSSAPVAGALCAEASVSLKQSCDNIPNDCNIPLIWDIQQSACVTSTVPLCKSIRTQTSECAFVNGAGETVVAAEYICDELTDKSPAFVDCDAPAVTCAADRGTCSGYESFTVEGQVQQNVLATCVCGNGFFDASCSTDVALSGLTATWNASTRAIDVAWTTNAAAVAGAKVTVFVTPASSGIAINATRVAIGALKSSISATALQLFPGTHTVKVTFSSTVSVTATVDIGALCDTTAGLTHSCSNGGSCNSVTGICSCMGSWSGAYCAVSPCEAAACNSDNTESCSVVDNEAQCNCRTAADGTALFRDALCEDAIDTTCSALTCANEGVPLIEFNQSSNAFECTNTCTCPDNSLFTGDLCDTCKNVCYNNGTASSIPDQCQCTCKPGYTSDNCSCRFAHLRLVFPQSALLFLGKANETEDLALWSSQLKTDVKTLGGKTSVFYTVANVSTVTTKKGKFVNVLISAGPECPAMANNAAAALPAAFAAHTASLRPTSALQFAAQADQPASVDMADTYIAIDAILAGLKSSPSTAGTALSTAVPTNIGVSDDACDTSCTELPHGTGTGMVLDDTADTDTGTDTEEEVTPHHSISNNHDNIIAGVVVGVGGFLIILVIVLIAWNKKLCCFADSSTKSATDKGGDVEMTPTNGDVAENADTAENADAGENADTAEIEV